MPDRAQAIASLESAKNLSQGEILQLAQELNAIAKRYETSAIRAMQRGEKHYMTGEATNFFNLAEQFKVRAMAQFDKLPEDDASRISTQR